MENASKALIIAGSILVVILLIAMGVSTFNSTKGTTDAVEKTMTATEIAMFNNKFLAYEGYNTKPQVLALMNLVIAHNATHTRQIKIFFPHLNGGTEYMPQEVIAGISDKTRFPWLIENEIDKNTGLVYRIDLSP